MSEPWRDFLSSVVQYFNTSILQQVGSYGCDQFQNVGRPRLRAGAELIGFGDEVSVEGELVLVRVGHGGVFLNGTSV